MKEEAGPAVQPQASTSGPWQAHCQWHQPRPLAGTGLCSNRAQAMLLHSNSTPAASADTIIKVHNSPQCGCCHSFSFIFSHACLPAYLNALKRGSHVMQLEWGGFRIHVGYSS